MKKLFLAFALLTCFAVSALGQSSPPLRVKEADGSPNVSGVTTIVVSNGSITSVQGKTIYLTTGGGGGGGSPGGSSTQVQYNAAGSFGGISGFTSDGTNVTAGSGNLRATRPRFITSIDDTNGNEVFVITATGSAVNEVTIANAATGNNPTFTASGGDANVGINFVPKGSGTIQVSGAAIVTVSATQTLTNKTLTTPIIAQISNTGTLTLPTSTDTLVGRATTDTLTNKTLSTSNTVSAALTWTAGVKQTFAPDATTAGINVGSVAGNPSGPSNADLWYNTATNELYARINGTNVALGSGGGGGITVGTTTITSGTNTRIPYNNAGVYGEISGFTSDGTNVTAGSGNLRATSPRITTEIDDANGAPMLIFSPTTSATQAITIANNTATNAVSLTASAPAAATATTAGTPFDLSASAATAGTTTAGAAAGGAITIKSGAAARLTSGNANGGNIILTGGAGVGTGTAGQVFITQAGAIGAPSLAIGSATDGIYSVGAGVLGFVTGGTARGGINSNGFFIPQLGIDNISQDNWLRRGGVNILQLAGNGNGTTPATFSTPARTPSQITSDQNNYAPGTGWFQRWSSDASRNITGMSQGNIDGQLMEIWNVGSNNIVLQNENASSTAANRFTTSTGADLTLTAGKCAIARYDTTSTRWRVYLCN